MLSIEVKQNLITSDIKLVSYSSTVYKYKMMSQLNTTNFIMFLIVLGQHASIFKQFK